MPSGGKVSMTCAEFQKVLPYIIDSGGNIGEQEHLKTCPICSDLVADLTYIADQAKLLVPMMEPNPRVWDEIKHSLEDSGQVKRSATKSGVRGRLLESPTRSRWGPATWLLPVAALVLVVIGLFLYRNKTNSDSTYSADQRVSPSSTMTLVNSDGMGETQDEQLLLQLSAQVPSLRRAYEQNLRSVNPYIADARRSVQTDPDDEDAQEALMQAYQQKAVLYDMAAQESVP